MIIPEYLSSPDGIYCTYNEDANHYIFPRYLTANGWIRFMWPTIYFKTVEEAQATFQRFNQAPLPVTDKEMADYLQEEKDFREHYYKSLEKEWENFQREIMQERY